jgi:hypothetical protein
MCVAHLPPDSTVPKASFVFLVSLLLPLVPCQHAALCALPDLAPRGDGPLSHHLFQANAIRSERRRCSLNCPKGQTRSKRKG